MYINLFLFLWDRKTISHIFLAKNRKLRKKKRRHTKTSLTTKISLYNKKRRRRN